MRALLLTLAAAAAVGLVLYLWQGDAGGRARGGREAAEGPAPAPPSDVTTPKGAEEQEIGITVVVKDVEGAPIAGATVGRRAEEVIVGPRVRRFSFAGETATTDAAGRCRLRLPPLPWYGIVARHPEYVRGSEFVPGGARLPAEVEIVLARGAPLTVLVLSPDKRPVPDAQVTVRVNEANGVFEASWVTSNEFGAGKTDAEGRVAIGGVPEVHLTVVVDHPDYALNRSEFDARGVAPIVHTVHLDGGGVLEGRVMDEAGAGIAGATVRLQDAERPSATTGADGTFRMEGVGAGEVHVIAEADRYGPGYFGERLGWDDPVPVPVRAGDVVTGIEIVLRKPTWITGQVVDEQGAGVAGVQVWVWIQGGYATDQQEQTDGDGRFHSGPWSLSDPGQAFVWFHSETCTVDEIQNREVAPGEDLYLGALKARSLGVVRGRVVDLQDEPVAGAQVAGRAATGADGTFELKGLRAGHVLLLAQVDDPEPLRARPVVVVLGPGEVKEGVELRLEPARAIKGRVITPEGQPRPGAMLAVRPVGLPEVPEDEHSALTLDDDHAWSDDQGKFAFASLPPGEYVVGILGTGKRWYFVGQMDFFEDPAPQTVEAGREDLEFVLPLKGGIIRGKVVSARDGRPIPEFEATFIKYRFLLPNETDSETCEKGGFEQEVDSPGTWQVDLAADGFAAHRTDKFSLEAGETKDLGTIRLGDGGSIAGLVRDAQGQPVPYTRINILNAKFQTNKEEPFTDLEGRFLLRAVSPGLYTVFAVSPAHPLGMVRNVEVQEGQRTDVAVDFVERAPLTILVRDENGAPVEGAELEFTFPAIAPLTSAMFRSKIPPGYGSAESDAAGQIVQPCLPPGEVTITIKAEEKGFLPVTKKLQLEPGEKNRVEIRLARAK